ncbi:MAG: class I SAM-dependent methyltransferase [Gammaproteobacteria bacterium]|nr:class I SAM-dependent methyltransferase [Gammaproteobacteria bacterium]MDH3466579.1 class I SAM-dependent methyltransferase [Gammaproteobacteria bacterium]
MVAINKAYELARLRKIARITRSGHILDIGYAQMPNPYYKGVTCVGLDLLEPTVDCKYAETIVGNALELPEALGSRRFDWIVAGEFIEHIRRPYDFLESLHGFLAPGGQIVLSTPNPIAWPTIIFEWAQSESRFYTKEHLYYFPPRWVKRMLDVSGYDLVDTIPVGLWLPKFVLPCPAFLSYQVIYLAKPR